MGNEIEPIKVLRQAFSDLAEAEAVKMVEAGVVKAYPAGTTLCHEGVIERTFYIIMDGEVRITKRVSETEERFICNLHPGSFFGEMGLIHDAPRGASVATTTACMMLEIEKDAFSEMVKQNSSVSMAMVREVSQRLRDNNDLAIEDLRVKAGELASAYQQLAEMEYARSEFLTVIAHELRTPLTVANGFVQVIRTQHMQGEALYSALDTVARNLQEIVALTNDILLLQEMDFILPDFEPTDLSFVVGSVVELQRLRAERNGVSIELSIQPSLPKIMGEARSLSRVIQAVLDNAVKFSPDGGDIQMEVGFDDRTVWVKVTDHGVGIPPESLPRVFDRFFHLEEVRGHMFRGVGLGLSIAKQVVEQHGGTIGIESELDKGSTITVAFKRIA